MGVKAEKITVVGAGTIGSTVAYALMLKELAKEIRIVNRNEAKGKIKAFDLSHCAPLTGGVNISSGSFEDSAGSDIVVVTVGVLPNEHGTRMDVLKSNIGIYKGIIPEIARYSPDAVIILVTNPVDVMAYAAYRLSGFPASRIIGSGTLLDTIRFRHLLGSRYGFNSSQVEAAVIGEHGDSMVHVWSRVKFLHTGLQDYLNEKGLILEPDARNTIEEETRRAGWNIRLGNEHSCYGISLSVVRIIEGILEFSEGLIPVSTLLCGDYGINGVFLSVPVLLGLKGIRKVEAVTLDDQEYKRLAESAEILRGYIQEADSLLTVGQ
ncbi:MAG: lactate/malate family dehydrogenase [Caulobacteraceae bacterium]